MSSRPGTPEFGAMDTVVTLVDGSRLRSTTLSWSEPGAGTDDTIRHLRRRDDALQRLEYAGSQGRPATTVRYNRGSNPIDVQPVRASRSSPTRRPSPQEPTR